MINKEWRAINGRQDENNLLKKLHKINSKCELSLVAHATCNPVTSDQANGGRTQKAEDGVLITSTIRNTNI